MDNKVQDMLLFLSAVSIREANGVDIPPPAEELPPVVLGLIDIDRSLGVPIQKKGQVFLLKLGLTLNFDEEAQRCPMWPELRSLLGSS